MTNDLAPSLFLSPCQIYSRDRRHQMLWPGLLGTLQLSNWRMRLRHGLVPVSGGCARGKLHWSMPSKIAALTCTCQHAGNCFQRIEWYSLHFQNDCSGHGACTMDHAGAGKCVCDTGYRSGLASLPSPTRAPLHAQPREFEGLRRTKPNHVDMP